MLGRSLLPQQHLEHEETPFKVGLACLMCTAKTRPLQDALCAGLRQGRLQTLPAAHLCNGKYIDLGLSPAQGSGSVACTHQPCDTQAEVSSVQYTAQPCSRPSQSSPLPPYCPPQGRKKGLSLALLHQGINLVVSTPNTLRKASKKGLQVS